MQSSIRRSAACCMLSSRAVESKEDRSSTERKDQTRKKTACSVSGAGRSRGRNLQELRATEKSSQGSARGP